MTAILKAADSFAARGTFGHGLKKRVRAMALLLRYSGLRISDAAILEKSRVQDGKIFLYQQKTGTPVWVDASYHGRFARQRSARSSNN